MTPGARRGLILALLLLAASSSYAVLMLGFIREAAVSERLLSSPAPDGARRLGVYVEVLSVDPVNESVRLRVSFTPGTDALSQRAIASSEDAILQIEGSSRQELAFRRSQPTGTATVEADLQDGTVADYPFDRFRAAVRIAAVSSPDDAASSIPMSVIVWERTAGWVIETAQEESDGAVGVRLRFHIRRDSALTFLVLAIYGGMALVGCAALMIGSFVFLHIRAAESGLISALSAMLFALPALRAALPGAPPLGVSADLLVFLWAELAVALGLALVIVAWVQGGSRS